MKYGQLNKLVEGDAWYDRRRLFEGKKFKIKNNHAHFVNESDAEEALKENASNKVGFIFIEHKHLWVK